MLIDTHFFNQFSRTKSSLFPKKAVENRNMIDIRLFEENVEDSELHAKNREGDNGDPREPPLGGKEERERAHHKAKD